MVMMASSARVLGLVTAVKAARAVGAIVGRDGWGSVDGVDGSAGMAALGKFLGRKDSAGAAGRARVGGWEIEAPTGTRVVSARGGCGRA